MWFIPKSHPEINNRIMLISIVLVGLALWWLRLVLLGLFGD